MWPTGTMFDQIAALKFIYMSIHKKVMDYYNIKPYAYYNLCAVVLDYDFFDENWNEVHAENLTRDEANFCIDTTDNWEGAKPSIMSMSLIYRILYLREQKRLKRINNITDLRKVIINGKSCMRLFRLHCDKHKNVDSFLLSYGYTSQIN